MKKYIITQYLKIKNKHNNIVYIFVFLKNMSYFDLRQYCIEFCLGACYLFFKGMDQDKFFIIISSIGWEISSGPRVLILFIYIGFGSTYTWCHFNYFTQLSISLLGANFNKSTIGLDSLIIFYMLAKFQDNIRSITTSSFKFLYIKLCIKEDSTMEIFTILKIQCLLSTVALFLVKIMHLSHFDQIFDFKSHDNLI